MEAKQIKKIHEAMEEHGFESIELELGKNRRLRLQLEKGIGQKPVLVEALTSEKEELIKNTQIEIRSDKVGSFYFADRQLKAGDKISKGEVIGSIKGISFKDSVKCSVDGVLQSAAVENGSVVDYGRLLFIVDIE